MRKGRRFARRHGPSHGPKEGYQGVAVRLREDLLQAYDVVLWRYFFQVGRQCAGAIVVPKPEEGEAVHVVGEDSKAVGMALRESMDWHRGVDIQRGRLPPQHHVLNVNENDQKDDRNDWGEQGVA